MKWYAMLKDVFLSVSMFLLLAGASLAQQGIVITQKMVNLDSDALQTLLAEKDFDDAESTAKFLFDLPFEQLASALKAQDEGQQAFTMVMYMQKQKIRMDMELPIGKMTTIVREDQDKMYNLMWTKKKYIEMPMKQMRDMRQSVKESMPELQNMPDLEKMLDKLPPEAREKALEAMKQSGQMQQMQKAQEKPKQHAEKTGRKREINGFACEEWIINEDTSILAFWVTLDKPEAAKLVQEYSKVLSQSMGTSKDQKNAAKEIWELVPGSIPIESRTYNYHRMPGPELSVALVEQIEEKTISSKTFELPEGFEKGSMFDMMDMNPGKKEWD